MSDRVYWLSIVLVLIFSTAFWWAILAWFAVSDPLPVVAIMDAIALTFHLLFVRWILKGDDSNHSSASHS